VIATASGAIPELIEEGVTGYVSKSLQDLAACLTDDKIQAISPEACRKNAERFSREAMAKGYEKLYEEVLSGGW
jgi:glycosyltransferase involved in cell wall biosynthesis